MLKAKDGTNIFIIHHVKNIVFDSKKNICWSTNTFSNFK